MRFAVRVHAGVAVPLSTPLRYSRYCCRCLDNQCDNGWFNFQTVGTLQSPYLVVENEKRPW